MKREREREGAKALVTAGTTFRERAERKKALIVPGIAAVYSEKKEGEGRQGLQPRCNSPGNETAISQVMFHLGPAIGFLPFPLENSMALPPARGTVMYIPTYVN